MTDGFDVSVDEPSVFMGGFTNNASDATIGGRDLHTSIEVVLRLFWDSIAQTLTSVYVLEDGSVWELARVELGDRWDLQPGGTFQLDLQGFTNTDLAIAAETAYLMDFKADGFVPLQDTQFLDDLKDALEPFWSGVGSTDIDAIDLEEGTDGLSVVHFDVLDDGLNAVSRTLQAVASVIDDWQVEVNVSVPNSDVGLTSIIEDDRLEAIRFSIIVNYSQRPNNLAFIEYGHLGFSFNSGDNFLSRSIISGDVNENPDLPDILEERGLFVPEVLLRITWDSAAHLLRFSYEVDGVIFDFDSIDPLERWGMQDGSTFEITIGGVSFQTQLELSAGEVIGTDFAAGGVSFFDDPVDIPDQNLEAAIRDELGIPGEQPQLTVGDLNSLTFLDASERGIGDLTGLEAAHNLEFLNLAGNQIMDLSPLSGLTILNNLDLPGNQIIDLNPLSELFSMVNLFLEDNRIVDIKPLENLTALEGIFLHRNNIFSINTLAGLVNLLDINVEDNFLDLRSGSEALDVFNQLLIIDDGRVIVYEQQKDPFAQLGFLDDLIDELDPGLWEFGTNSENPGLLNLLETPSGFSFIQSGPRDDPSERLVTKQLNSFPPFDSDWSAAVDVSLGHVEFAEIGERIAMEFTLFNSANGASLFHSVNVLATDDGFGNPVLEQRIDVGNFSIFGFQGFNGVGGLRRTVSGDYYTLFLFWIAESQTLVTAYEVNGVFSEAISSNLGSSWLMEPGDTFTLNLAGFTEAETAVDPEILFFNNFAAGGVNINPTGSVTVNFDPGSSDFNDGMQWRVNGQDWQPNGATVFGINAGEALIEYRPVLGFDPLPADLIYVDENADNVVDRSINALAGTFGALDPNFNLPEFKQETGPVRVNSDRNGGLLISWADFHNVNNEKTGALIRVHDSDGSLDENFNFGPPLFSTLATTVLDDGMILVSGNNGVPLADGSTRNRILRVFPDGSQDFSFESPVFNDGIRMLTAQPNGKVLAGGTFTDVDGLLVSGLVRLNVDGSLDQDFQIPELIQHQTTGFQNGIWARIILDGDGNIYIGGSFGTVNGEVREGFARLFPDGSLDLDYGVGGYVMVGRPPRGIGFQSDGSLVIGGRFEDDSGTEAVLIRLDPNGDFDSSFVLVSRNEVADTVAPFFLQVRNLRIASNDKIVIAGTTIARFNSDGSLDTSFARAILGDAGEYNESFSLELLPDDSVVFPSGDGDIPEVNGVPLLGLGRLAVNDGTFDPTFTPGSFQSEWYPEDFAVLSDGRVVVWDDYDYVGAERRDGLAGFETDGTLDGTYDLSVIHSDLVNVVDAGILSDDRLQYIADTDSGRVYGRLNADGTPDDGTLDDSTTSNIDFISDEGISPDIS